MAGLQDQIFEGAAWVPSIERFTNTVPLNDISKPVSSIVPNYSGEALADVYTLTFTDVDTIVHTAKVYVQTAAPNNPYRNQIGILIDIDGITIYNNVIPGYDIVFSGSASFLNSYEAEVRVGTFQGTFNAYGEDAGTPGVGKQHRVKNTDSGAAADCKVTLKPIVIQIRRTGTIFELVKPYADAAAEKVSGGGSQRVMPYHITVENLAGIGIEATLDIKVDGNLVNVRNLSGGVEGTSETLNVVDNYKIISGELNSVEFKLSELADNSSETNILVFSSRYVQIASDISGVAGTYGVIDIQLTQAGESAGIIQPEGIAYYWLRTVVPEGANSESNPYPSNVFVTGKQTGTAGWVA